MKVDVKGSDLVCNNARKGTPVVNRSFLDILKDIAKIHRLPWTVVDNGGGRCTVEYAYNLRGTNLLRSIHVLISGNIFHHHYDARIQIFWD